MSTRFEPRWLNTDEAAQYLNVFPSAISRLVKAGLIRPVNPAGVHRHLFDRHALDAMMEAQARKAKVS
jgi:excisionase family DNA binding protein